MVTRDTPQFETSIEMRYTNFCAEKSQIFNVLDSSKTALAGKSNEASRQELANLVQEASSILGTISDQEIQNSTDCVDKLAHEVSDLSTKVATYREKIKNSRTFFQRVCDWLGLQNRSFYERWYGLQVDFKDISKDVTTLADKVKLASKTKALNASTPAVQERAEAIHTTGDAAIKQEEAPSESMGQKKVTVAEQPRLQSVDEQEAQRARLQREAHRGELIEAMADEVAGVAVYAAFEEGRTERENEQMRRQEELRNAELARKAETEAAEAAKRLEQERAQKIERALASLNRLPVRDAATDRRLDLVEQGPQVTFPVYSCSKGNVIDGVPQGVLLFVKEGPTKATKQISGTIDSETGAIFDHETGGMYENVEAFLRAYVSSGTNIETILVAQSGKRDQVLQQVSGPIFQVNVHTTKDAERLLEVMKGRKESGVIAWKDTSNVLHFSSFSPVGGIFGIFSSEKVEHYTCAVSEENPAVIILKNEITKKEEKVPAAQFKAKIDALGTPLTAVRLQQIHVAVQKARDAQAIETVRSSLVEGQYAGDFRTTHEWCQKAQKVFPQGTPALDEGMYLIQDGGENKCSLQVVQPDGTLSKSYVLDLAKDPGKICVEDAVYPTKQACLQALHAVKTSREVETSKEALLGYVGAEENVSRTYMAERKLLKAALPFSDHPTVYGCRKENDQLFLSSLKYNNNTHQYDLQEVPFFVKGSKYICQKKEYTDFQVMIRDQVSGENVYSLAQMEARKAAIDTATNQIKVADHYYEKSTLGSLASWWMGGIKIGTRDPIKDDFSSQQAAYKTCFDLADAIYTSSDAFRKPLGPIYATYPLPKALTETLKDGETVISSAQNVNAYGITLAQRQEGSVAITVTQGVIEPKYTMTGAIAFSIKFEGRSSIENPSIQELLRTVLPPKSIGLNAAITRVTT